MPIFARQLQGDMDEKRVAGIMTAICSECHIALPSVVTYSHLANPVHVFLENCIASADSAFESAEHELKEAAVNAEDAIAMSMAQRVQHVQHLLSVCPQWTMQPNSANQSPLMLLLANLDRCCNCDFVMALLKGVPLLKLAS